MDVCLALKTFYLGTTAAIVFAYETSPLKDRFLAYGARSATDQVEHHTGSIEKKSNENATDRTKRHAESVDIKSDENSIGLPFAHLLKRPTTPFDFLASLQVPHSWFVSFYCVSVASSLLWGYQLLTREAVYQKVASWKHPAESMSLDRIALCCSLMALQGARRLWECLVLTKPSKSRMWVFHWLAGVLFYVATGVSVWIEGVPVLDSTDRDIRLSTPSLRVVVCVLAFLVASAIQHNIHVHLASLKKYSLPFHSAFRNIVCPHYTAECALYLALTCLAAPQGQPWNGTMLCATIFVIVNLGITADISKTWAMEKFGKEKVEGKWRMLPGVW